MGGWPGRRRTGQCGEWAARQEGPSEWRKPEAQTGTAGINSKTRAETQHGPSHRDITGDPEITGLVD